MTLRKHILAGGVIASLLAGTAYASVIDRPFFQVLGVVVVWGADDFSDNAGAAPVVSDFILMTGGTGTSGDLTDLISDDVYAVVTGSLDPVASDASATDGTVDPITGETSGGAYTDANTDGLLDAGDSLTAFGIDNTTDVDGLVGSHTSSFYVASNTAFDIYASATAATTTGDFSSMDEANITFSLAVDAAGDTDGAITWGGNAQDPATGGTGVVAAIDSLDDMAAATKVFDGGRRTAATVGSIADQSVRFDATYELDSDTGTAGVQGYDLSLGAGSIYSDVTYTVYVP